MNFIQQAYKGKLGYWKYVVFSSVFLGLMFLNTLAIKLLNIDVEALMRDEIAKKGENLVLIENLVPFVFLLAILFFWVKVIHKQSLQSLTTSRKKIDFNRFWFAFISWGLVTTIVVCFGYLLSPTSLEFNFELNKFLGLLLIGIVLIPIQTSFEEYFFRGYLLQGIGAKFKSRFLPLILTSVIFGLLHLGNPEVEKIGGIIMIYYIGTGLFLGIITLMDEGLELALGFHAANNLITALLVTANWTAFQTNSIFKDLSMPSIIFDVLFPVFVLYPLLLLLFSKKYGWENWKEKLCGKIEKPVTIE